MLCAKTHCYIGTFRGASVLVFEFFTNCIPRRKKTRKMKKEAKFIETAVQIMFSHKFISLQLKCHSNFLIA